MSNLICPFVLMKVEIKYLQDYSIFKTFCSASTKNDTFFTQPLQGRSYLHVEGSANKYGRLESQKKD